MPPGHRLKLLLARLLDDCRRPRYRPKDRALRRGLFLLARRVSSNAHRAARAGLPRDCWARRLPRADTCYCRPRGFSSHSRPFLRETFISHGSYAQRLGCISARQAARWRLLLPAQALSRAAMPGIRRATCRPSRHSCRAAAAGKSHAVSSMDRDLVWDQVVDVVDDYFRMQHEERVRLVGDLLTEGRLDTYPRSGSTIFEPWNRDSVTPHTIAGKARCNPSGARRWSA